jgi:2-keto-4-pentenoate hydratase/2-oxohepta-3-ene-1,7-dioic acid hydratase in catechol pathway
LPLVGFVPEGGGRKCIVHHNGSSYSVSRILGLNESELEKNFFTVLWNHEDDLKHPDDDALIKTPTEKYLPPVPLITSIRDFFAFEEHVRNARKTRSESVPPEWYNFPVFYFSNHNSVIGSMEELHYPRYTKELDYEMELAFIIGKEGKNISADSYEEYVAGVTIANDWSARDVQRAETRIGLGPAKGKDFATSLGPFMLTAGDLSLCKISRGKYDIQLSGIVNGKTYGSGNMKDIYFDLGSIIERASEEVTLRRGDIIMTGTFGNGCILEMRNQGKSWLSHGDEVTIKSSKIGMLTNKVV